MSSVIKRPFGELQLRKGRQRSFNQAVFRLKVEGYQIRELIDFLELIYKTPIEVTEKNGTVLRFYAAPHRTVAGIRVGLRIYNVTLIFLQEW